MGRPGAACTWYCPVSGVPLELLLRTEAERRLGGPVRPAERIGSPAVGPTAEVAFATGRAWCYPVLDTVPILLAPERLYAEPPPAAADVTRPPYAEPYSEVARYTEHVDNLSDASVLSEAARFRSLAAAVETLPPFPATGTWVGGQDDIGAQERAMGHLAPVAGCDVLQIGGTGAHALNMLAAGASRALLVSPVLAEVRWCLRVAAEAGLAERVGAACAIAEELPLAPRSVDIVYSPGSMHHSVTDRSFGEVARIMAPGGRFASVDVYRSALYEVGIRLFGKSDPGVACRPLDSARLDPASALPGLAISFHGSVFRYPLAVASRRGRVPSLGWSRRLAAVEDALAGVVPALRRLASLVCVTATAPGTE